MQTYLQGWETVLNDKCCNNTIQDVLNINLPYDLNKKQEVPQECKSFIYAAYLPPGLHQLVLYCPVTKRAFCKDIIVDLSTLDPYPEFPTKIKPPIKKFKKTRANVWRKWREDSTEDINLAFSNDIGEESYDPSLFIKDP